MDRKPVKHLFSFNQPGEMDKISLVTLTVTPFWADQTVLLAESLRSFGGQLAQVPLTVLTPTGTVPLPQKVLDKLSAQNAEIIPINIEEAALKFPLGFLPFAAAEAEKLAKGKSELLAWMLPDTLFISSPKSFLLPQGKQLGYRPVHHSNIGSEIMHPPDAFWSLVLSHCKVPEKRIFPMETCTRDKVVRPYINAGMLVTRPENGFMNAWMQSFQNAYRHEDFVPLLADKRNAIFLHQAVLSGVMMHQYSLDELYELPETINYPLHLHDEYPNEYKPKTLKELITCRFESIQELRQGLEKIRVEPPIKAWLDNRL
jgi:hypothetical protein